MSDAADSSLISRSVALFIFAGMAEIGSGYSIWRWLREGRSVFVGLVGAGVIMYWPRS